MKIYLRGTRRKIKMPYRVHNFNPETHDFENDRAKFMELLPRASSMDDFMDVCSQGHIIALRGISRCEYETLLRAYSSYLSISYIDNYLGGDAVVIFFDSGVEYDYFYDMAKFYFENERNLKRKGEAVDSEQVQKRTRN